MPFFPNFAPSGELPQVSAAEKAAILKGADALIGGQVQAFGGLMLGIKTPPDWYANVVTGQRVDGPERHWSDIPDFSSSFGEIKTVWELSRLDWAVLLAMAYRLGGDTRHLAMLNDWLDDWVRRNPPNQGPNWKCGQETSIRVLHLLQASLVLSAGTPGRVGPRLESFVIAHAERVMATRGYATAQDNNHGTSEATALFVCGLWLERFAETGHRRARFARWARLGRDWLEERMTRLVLKDGTFSQYSPTYHRVLLATLTQALLWQGLFGAPDFSARFHSKLDAALAWLAQLTDPVCGDAPNLGANDGANIFLLSRQEDYRDFRPVLSTLAQQLGVQVPWAPGADRLAIWFGVAAPKPVERSLEFSNRSMPEGGLEKLVAPDGRSWVLLRAARFRFRPAHADVNHVDLWYAGRNLLMDAGTYSYAEMPPGSVHALRTAFAHNTITFDDHDQMPALGRFLYGAWPRGMVRRADDGTWVESEVRFADGNRHRRRVAMEGPCLWTIEDEIEGPFHRALLRWHVPNADWQKESANRVRSPLATITIDGSGSAVAMNALQAGTVSRSYLADESCKVIEIAFVSNGKPLRAKTTISFG